MPELQALIWVFSKAEMRLRMQKSAILFSVLEDSFEQWAEILKTNTAAPHFVTMGFLSLLERGACTREGETSSVINISAVGGTAKVLLGVVAYPVSKALKAAVNHLTEVLATQFALQNIPVRVNTISPGLFPSEMTATPKEIARWAAKPVPGTFNPSPLLRAGRQLEIGTAAVFLSSVAGLEGKLMIAVYHHSAKYGDLDHHWQHDLFTKFPFKTTSFILWSLISLTRNNKRILSESLTRGRPTRYWKRRFSRNVKVNDAGTSKAGKYKECSSVPKPGANSGARRMLL
ncbi:hypothetical protein D9758_013584 [Tetrapyrgos nigripes]|uniref:Uncharacterized protein n=1 Tax=Tetrapyrgos nigripes TaxID=182062 RepID=A0A8H5C9N9_9AGAR|nr:hypothetical protein D9758_013584 [Tetrapyrgos nigripes]